MKDSEISTIANEILRKRFSQSGFQGADALSDIDFDGSSIVRVTAHYDKGPLEDVREIAQAMSDIRSELWKQGDHRFVFLENEYPGDSEERDEEDEEEDFDSRASTR